MRHIVQIAKGTDALEMMLDNGANKGWTLISVFESTKQTSQFYVIYRKEND